MARLVSLAEACMVVCSRGRSVLSAAAACAAGVAVSAAAQLPRTSVWGGARGGPGLADLNDPSLASGRQFFRVLCGQQAQIIF
mmetsp:Transcript_84615/g.226154  ORF Transcript_84615/g.226154 Transcript_84615/m.226154 type:complete len:83 (+) Transcript_84615:1183-1431(+)